MSGRCIVAGVSAPRGADCALVGTCSCRPTRVSVARVEVTSAAEFYYRGEWQSHPAGEVLSYQPEDAAGGSLLTWSTWDRERGLVGHEADCDAADAIARELGIYRAGPLACRPTGAFCQDLPDGEYDCAWTYRAHEHGPRCAVTVEESARRAAQSAEEARWFAWLAARTGVADAGRAIESLGGYDAARAAYRAEAA